MRKLLFITTVLFFVTGILKSQHIDTLTGLQMNSAEALMAKDGNLGIGGYGEVHFNQPMNNNIKEPGTFDVHRLVMFLGYNFSKETQFVSEIEFEYAKELWVEQAFLQHKINKYINARAGLLLIPMGIINEYHEPVTFNGVERPTVDNKIAPATWREIGAGISGNILEAKLKYQAYFVNGLSGFDAKGIFSGSGGLREGRQKGSKAYSFTPSITAKAEFYGIKNLNIGLAGYYGNSQSKLYNKLHKDSSMLKTKADSSVVGIAMLGLDARYGHKGFETRGQVYFISLSNTEKYNRFTRIVRKNNDLGKALFGYYAEVAYNVFRLCEKRKDELIPFVRFEHLNTHFRTDALTKKNSAYESKIITAGITYKLNKNAVAKLDSQFTKVTGVKDISRSINAGIAVQF